MFNRKSYQSKSYRAQPPAQPSQPPGVSRGWLDDNCKFQHIAPGITTKQDAECIRNMTRHNPPATLNEVSNVQFLY